MYALDLLRRLKTSDISIYNEGGTLRLKAAAGKVTPGLLDEIKTYKDDLLHLLTAAGQTQDLIPRAPDGQDFPVTFQQRSIWLACQHPEESRSYNLSVVLAIHAPQAIGTIEQALADVVGRHEVFQTSFFQDSSGELRQRLENTPFGIEHRDISGADESRVKEMLTEESRNLFNLEHAPLIRATLLKRNTGDSYLVVVVHHLIFDGVSAGLFRDELMTAFRARAQGLKAGAQGLTPGAQGLKAGAQGLTPGAQGPMPVAPVPGYTYKDFASWEHHRIHNGAWQSEEQFWKDKLGGDLPVIQLVHGHRPPIKTNAGTSLRFHLPEAMTTALEKNCHSVRCSLFSGLLAALHALLFRYTGNKHLLVGTISAGREQLPWAMEIGLFINTIPLLTEVLPDWSFMELVQHQQSCMDEAFAHQLPFGYLTGVLNKKRDASRSALFDVLVDYEDARGAQPSHPAFSFVREDFRGTSHFDLLFSFTAVSDGVEATVEFNPDIYSSAIIRRCMDHYLRLLNQAMNDPHRSVGDLEYLSPEEENELLLTFSGADVALEEGHTFLDLFAEIVRGGGDRVALRFGDTTISYARLDQLSNGVALFLLDEYALQPNDLVGIKLLRSEWVLILMIGILKAGGAYVPMDMSYPGERIDLIVKDSGCRLLIDEEALVHIRARTGNGIANAPAVEVAPSSLVYVIYTSGSTGTPKGVMITHRNLYNYLVYGLEEWWRPSGLSYKIPLFSSLSFDLPVTAVYGALVTGGELVIYPQDANAAEAMEDIFTGGHGFNFVKCTPAHIALLSNIRGQVSDVAELVTGGQELKAEHLHLLLSMNPAITLFNEYGPTETTVASTAITILKKGVLAKGVERRLPSPNITIGSPIFNTRIYILDDRRRLLPVGVAGEIYIGGAGVARGYRNKEELTNARFIPDVFSTDAGARLYKTGDLAKWLPDGNIEYIGRADEQVKIRGYRVEPAEVEQALLQLEGMEAVLVMGMTGEDGEKQLVAYMVSAVAITVSALRAHLLNRLPEYMIPAFFVRLDSFPLNPNGKIDKQQLPLPAESAIVSGAAYVGPRNLTEIKMAGIWRELLGYPGSIGVEDDFFSLGGHSLLVMQLVNHYHQAFQVKLPIRQLFFKTTIASHAELIASENKTHYSDIESLQPAADHVVSDGQRRIWVISQVEEASRAYHLPGQLMLEGDYQAHLLGRAIVEVIGRHEILRTVFRQKEDGELRQVVLPAEAVSFRLQEVNLSGEVPEKVRDYLQRETSRAFDLSRGPLLRVGLILLGPRQYLLYYTMHHIISDGVSIELLGKEVLRDYDRLVSGRPAEGVPLRIQYKEYAAWQQQQLQTEEHQQHRRYWLEQLSGQIPVLQLAGDKTRPLTKAYAGAIVSTPVDKKPLSKLHLLCGRQNGTLFMGLLAVLKTLLYRYTGQEDIIIGCPVSGREHPELEEQIGFYINTLALRTQFTGADSFETLLQKTCRTTLLAYEHQSYPFDRLVEELGVKRDLSRSPLFDVFVNFQHHSGSIGSPRPSARGDDDLEDGGPSACKFDLLFNFHDSDEECILYLEYDTELFDASTIGRLVGHFKGLLSAAVSTPEVAVGRLEYVPAREREQLVEGFNATETIDLSVSTGPGVAAGPAVSTPEELFAGAVSLYGDRPAVQYGTRRLSYRELDEASGRVAGYLRQVREVRPGMLVGVRLERSDWVPVVIWGILRTGAGYVPLEMSYPQERLDYIIRDSGCQVVVDAAEVQRLEAWPHGDEPSSSAPGASASSASSAYRSDSIAYLIYTSGSTGQPKGVAVSRENVVNYLAYCQKKYFSNPTAAYRMPLFTSLSFDLTVTSILGLLVSGGELVIYPQAQDIQQIVEDIFYGVRGITVLKCTPSHLRVLEEVEGRETKVEQVIVGGEELKVHQVQRLGRIKQEMLVHNEYGPTEATVGCVVETVVAGSQLDGSSVPIGRPIGGMWMYVLDGNRQLVPVGVKGELNIGGRGVALGYWGQPELTAGRFVADPWRWGERLYRSGDVCRWREDGRLEFFGRGDEQVKIRGYRIEPGEIEAVLRGYEGVGDAVVIKRETEKGEGELTAYLRGAAGVETAGIETYLLQRLPVYMVPRHYVVMEELPLTANGKIDRKRLPDPEPDDNITYIAPRNFIEEKITEACRRLFREQVIGVRANFFDLGGDSIKAILLSSQLKRIGLSVAVGDIMKYPVLEEMAMRVKTLDQLVSRETVEGDVALTPIQRWFLEKEGDKERYHQSVLLDSRQRLEADRVRLALEALARHHDALRMVFTRQDRHWYAFNRGTENKLYHLQEHDLREMPDPAVTMAALCDDLQAGFDLANGPLLKAGLFHLPDGDRLLLVIHHLVVDGVSWRILLEDLSTAYRQIADGQPVSLPAKTDSFRKWARLLQEYAEGAALAGEIPYWHSLAASVERTLPWDLPEENGRMDGCATYTIVLNETTTEALLTKAHRVYDTEINHLLLTALALAVKRTFGRSQVLVELEGHGREELFGNVDVDRTVGWFTAIFPVLLSMDNTGNPVDYLVHVKEQLRKIPGKGVGYGMIRYLRSGGKSILQNIPQADVTFNYLGDAGIPDAGDGEALFVPVLDHSGNGAGGGRAPKSEGRNGSDGEGRNGSDGEERSRSDGGIALNITGVVIDGRMKFSFEYGRRHYEGGTIETLADNFGSCLKELTGMLAAELMKWNAGGDFQDMYGLSPLQEGIYYHWLSEPDVRLYVEQMAYRLKGVLDLDILRRSYALLVDRHAILRTSFKHMEGPGNVQIVKKTVPADFRYKDLRNMPDITLLTGDYKKEDRNEGFDISVGSQMRLSVLQIADDEYEFIWTYHHILMDGWCTPLLINEFYSIYRSWANGREPVLDRIVPYAEYIRWLSRLDRDFSRRFWTGYLRGYEEASPLPFGRSSSGRNMDALGKESLALTAGQVDSINRICHTERITGNTFIQCAWGYLLSRYNDNRDVVFGTVVSGRPAQLPGVEGIIGLFINTIPVRIQYTNRTTIRELLRNTQQQAIECLPHHYLALAEIQLSTPLRNNLFDHIVVYENYPVQLRTEGTGGDAGLEALELIKSEVSRQTNFDFELVMVPGDGSIDIRFYYNQAVFSSAAIRRMKDHLQTVLACFIDAVDTPLSEVPYVPAREREQLVEGFNATEAIDLAVSTGLGVSAGPAVSTPEELFARAVELYGDRPAVQYGTRRLSYCELDEASGRVADYLQQVHEVRPGMLVAVRLERSEWVPVVIWGILRTGAGYVPLEMSYPQERLDYIVRDSGCQVVIDAAEVQRLEAWSHGDEPSSSAPGASASSPPAAGSSAASRSDSIAYLIYTSGSTGQPKGVAVSRENVVNYLGYCQKKYFANPTAVYRMPLFTSLSFDLTVTSILGLLVSGGELVIYPQDQNLQQIVEDIFYGIKAITVLKCTPSHLRLLDEVQGRDTHVEQVIVGGEELKVHQVQRLGRMKGDLVVHNEYGPTEATVGCVVETVVAGDRLEGSSVSIGRPIGGMWMYVLDGNRQLVPVGVKGELYIGGRGVALGYWRRPEVTADRFVADPWRWGERLYRSGDVCRWGEDGRLEYLGRQDEQVKIRGYRIEPAEIEEVLRGYEGVEDAVVVKGETAQGEGELIAYLRSSTEVETGGIQAYLTDRLPAYMAPQHYVVMEEFPLTANGKIDRKRLPDPAMQEGEEEEYVPPGNEVEKRLVEIWEEVLATGGKIGIRDNFFELGGHSIKAIRILSKVSREYAVVISIQKMFEEPTIENLAGKILNAQWFESGPDRVNDPDMESVKV